MSVQVLRFAFTEALQAPALARQTEADGWDGLLLSDSQCLQSDVYASLALAARETGRIVLGPGVTNPVTRDPSVTAGAIATIQQISGGRALLGLGRGDTALLQIGRKPVSVQDLQRGLQAIQGYLHGPDRLRWIDGLPKVPVDVFGSGPSVLKVGALGAERVTLAVGAHAEWVRWALDGVHRAREEAGLDPRGVACGLTVCMGISGDPDAAREQVRGNAALFAAFAGAARRVPGLLAPEDQQVLDEAARAYGHGTVALPDGFLDRFAVCGPAQACLARLRELASLGLSHLVVVGPSKFAAHGAAEEFAEAMRAEVLPGLSGRGGPRSPSAPGGPGRSPAPPESGSA